MASPNGVVVPPNWVPQKDICFNTQEELETHLKTYASRQGFELCSSYMYFPRISLKEPNRKFVKKGRFYIKGRPRCNWGIRFVWRETWKKKDRLWELKQQPPAKCFVLTFVSLDGVANEDPHYVAPIKPKVLTMEQAKKTTLEDERSAYHNDWVPDLGMRFKSFPELEDTLQKYGNRKGIAFSRSATTQTDAKNQFLQKTCDGKVVSRGYFYLRGHFNHKGWRIRFQYDRNSWRYFFTTVLLDGEELGQAKVADDGRKRIQYLKQLKKEEKLIISQAVLEELEEDAIDENKKKQILFLCSAETQTVSIVSGSILRYKNFGAIR